MLLTPATTNIPSYAFSKDYCIFITKKAAPHFAEKVALTNMKHAWGVEVWESTNKIDNLAVIIIGKHAPFWQIEEDLFNYWDKETDKDVISSFFRGQHDIGYKDKKWNLVD